MLYGESALTAVGNVLREGQIRRVVGPPIDE